jgi:hypothetical protein
MKGETVVGYKGLVCRYLLETTTLYLQSNKSNTKLSPKGRPFRKLKHGVKTSFDASIAWSLITVFDI